MEVTMRRQFIRGRNRSVVGKLESACQRTLTALRKRGLHVLIPVSAGALIMGQHASGQVQLQGNGTSFFSLSFTPDVNNNSIAPIGYNKNQSTWTAVNFTGTGPQPTAGRFQ